MRNYRRSGHVHVAWPREGQDWGGQVGGQGPNPGILEKLDWRQGRETVAAVQQISCDGNRPGGP